MFKAGVIVFCGLLSVGVAWAEPTSEDLIKIQEQLRQEQQSHRALQERAKQTAKEVSAVQKQMVNVAKEVQNVEETLSDLESNLAQLQIKQTEVKTRLDARQAQLVQVVSGIQKMAIYPPETSLLQPNNPADNLRSSLLLKETRKPLQATANRLRQDLQTLHTLSSAIQTQMEQIKNVSARLEVQKELMDKLFKQKSLIKTHFESESLEAKKKASQLGRQASNLQDLLEKLETERKHQQKLATLASKQKPLLDIPTIPTVAGAFEKSLGSLPLPARGRIVQYYGDKLPSGLEAKGLTLLPRPNAQVIAPFDGTVLFAGPFKGYGNLLILEHGEGYHSLLSGLTRMDVSVGQSVLTGEPIGIMSTNGSEKLYIEFRKNGAPVNPSAWFAIKKK